LSENCGDYVPLLLQPHFAFSAFWIRAATPQRMSADGLGLLVTAAKYT
jgi:hypothetical protein